MWKWTGEGGTLLLFFFSLLSCFCNPILLQVFCYKNTRTAITGWSCKVRRLGPVPEPDLWGAYQEIPQQPDGPVKAPWVWRHDFFLTEFMTNRSHFVWCKIASGEMKYLKKGACFTQSWPRYIFYYCIWFPVLKLKYKIIPCIKVKGQSKSLIQFS